MHVMLRTTYLLAPTVRKGPPSGDRAGSCARGKSDPQRGNGCRRSLPIRRSAEETAADMKTGDGTGSGEGSTEGCHLGLSGSGRDEVSRDRASRLE